MPSQPYNLVKDEPDLRVPVHSDEAFYTGISFQAKVRSLPLCKHLLWEWKNAMLKGIMLSTFLVCRKKTIALFFLMRCHLSYLCILSQS